MLGTRYDKTYEKETKLRLTYEADLHCKFGEKIEGVSAGLWRLKLRRQRVG